VLLITGPMAGCGRVGYDLLGVDGDGDVVQLDGEVPVDAAGFDAAGIDAAGIDAAGIDSGGIDAAGIDAAGIDAGGVDGGRPPTLGPFGTPSPVAALNTSFPESDPTATGDALEMYFASDRAVANLDIYRSTRASRSDPWGTPVRVAELSSLDNDTTPEIAPDGLTIYLASTRSGGRPQYDIYRSTRASRSDPWGAPTLVSELTTDDDELSPTPSADGRRIVMHRFNFSHFDIVEATRGSASGPFGTPTPLSALNTTAHDGAPFLWDGGLTVLFDSARPGEGSWDLYVATRPSLSDPFAGVTGIAELNTAEKESGPWVSPDGSYILFTRGEEGVGTNGDIWEASR